MGVITALQTAGMGPRLVRSHVKGSGMKARTLYTTQDSHSEKPA